MSLLEGDALKDAAKDYFRSFDLNGEGHINKAVWLDLFGSWSENDRDRLWLYCDKSGDGCVNYHSFVEWVMGAPEGMQAQVHLTDFDVYSRSPAVSSKTVQLLTADQAHTPLCTISDFCAFVPTILQRNLVRCGEQRVADAQRDAQYFLGKLEEPQVQRFPGAFLFADASGFTALTEELAKHKHGAELLCNALNSYFDELISIVLEWGGDVIKFAGDAMLCLWPVLEDDSRFPSLQEACLCAAACSFKLHEQLHNYEAAPGVFLSLHMGLAAGEIIACTVGGVFSRWEYVQFGDPLDQIAVAEPAAARGETVACPTAWSMLQNHADGIECVQAPGFFTLKSMNSFPTKPPPVELAITSQHQRALQQFIPASVHKKLKVGLGMMLAQARQVSVIFLKVTGCQLKAHPLAANDILRTFQTAVYTYEGAINKFLVDDKGTLLMAVFGVGMSHTNDPARALDAALVTVARIQDLGFHAHAGVTTGVVFSGTVGSPLRREYTVMGDTINLAARLMAASESDTVLCDDSSYALASKNFEWKHLSPIHVKGKKALISIYRPVASLGWHDSKLGPLRGRSDETTKVVNALRSFKGSPANATQPAIVIRGFRFVGKTQLANDLIKNATAMDLCVMSGAVQLDETDAVVKISQRAYEAFQTVFQSMLGLPVMHCADGLHLCQDISSESTPAFPGMTNKALCSLFSPQQLQWASFLNDYIPGLNILENDIKECGVEPFKSVNIMSRSHRDLQVLPLLEAVIRHVSSQCKIVIVLDNAHGMDKASWELVDVCRKCPNVQVCLCLRSMVQNAIFEKVPDVYTELINDAATCVLNVKSLDSSACKLLLADYLGVGQIEEVFSHGIIQTCECNPWFLQRYADELLHNENQLIVSDGIARAGPQYRHPHFPNPIRGSLMSFIDRLAPEAQLSLSVAACLSNPFHFQALRAVYPHHATLPTLWDNVQVALVNELLEVAHGSTEDDLEVEFVSLGLRKLARSLLLEADRSEIQAAFVRWNQAQDHGSRESIRSDTSAWDAEMHVGLSLHDDGNDEDHDDGGSPRKFGRQASLELLC